MTVAACSSAAALGALLALEWVEVMQLTNATLDLGATGDTVRDLARQIAAEYAEMPGLCVTLPQAARLWAVDRNTCQAAFDRLIARGALRITTKGRFVRA